MRFFGRLTFVAEEAVVALPMSPVARLEQRDNREPSAQSRRPAPAFATQKPGYTAATEGAEK